MKTHCKNGHEFTPENTYVRPDGARICFICKRAANRKVGARRRQLLRELRAKRQ